MIHTSMGQGPIRYEPGRLLPGPLPGFHCPDRPGSGGGKMTVALRLPGPCLLELGGRMDLKSMLPAG